LLQSVQKVCLIMHDTLSKKARSLLMAEVKGRDNKSTEIELARLLRASHISGWRRHLNLPGKPDFTFPKERVCIFVDGCFWHGCPKHYQAPKDNAEYWRKKLLNNRRRDAEVRKQLIREKYRVIRIWECELRDRAKVLRKINVAMKGRRKKTAR